MTQEKFIVNTPVARSSLDETKVGGVTSTSEPVTVTMVLSEAEAVPSDTVRVNSMSVSSETLGAVNDVSTAELFPKDMESVELCVHA